MSAEGTKKPFGDTAVQLTFPLEYQKAYEMSGAPVGYFPSFDGMPLEVLVGTDEQAQYHEQKRLDANRTVMDGLQANRSAERKLLTGPHNYHLPKPVLSQRIYANPSLGDVGFQSTRRDNGTDAPFRTVEVGSESMMGSGLRGGVRTNEGYSFYRGQLQRRIGQLDRLDALAQGFAVPMGQSYRTENNRTSGSDDKVEFFYNLQLLQDNVTEGNIGPQPAADVAVPAATALSTLRAVVNGLVKFGPSADIDDLNDMLDSFDTIIQTLQPEDDQRWGEYQQPHYTMTILKYVGAMREYANNMMAGLDLQPREKEALSKSLAKQLFKGSLRSALTQRELLRSQEAFLRREGDDAAANELAAFIGRLPADRQRRAGPPVRDEATELERRIELLRREGRDDDADDIQDFLDGGPRPEPMPTLRNPRARRGRGIVGGAAGFEGQDLGGFDVPAPTREDTEMPIARQPFAGRSGDPMRERFGAVGRRGDTLESAYFGEDNSPDQSATEKTLAYPLDMAGYDPTAEASAPQADTDGIVDALDTVIESVLDPLKTEADKDLDLDEVVAKHYPQKQVFINEVEKGMEERGFSKAQIAAAMSKKEGITFDGYAAENAGPLGPTRAEPARRFRPDTSSAAPVYGEMGAVGEPATSSLPSGFPATREELRSQVSSLRDLMRVGAMLSPPYVPREGTKLSNAITALISKVRKVEPTY